MFVVVGVIGVHRMERLVPLLVIVVLRHGNRLGNFGRDEELLLFEIFPSFVQFWRHRSWHSVFRWRRYPMQQPKAENRNCQTWWVDERGQKLPKDTSQ